MGRNTVGKGEIARHEQFLLFPQCFQKACFPGASKGVIVWEWVKFGQFLNFLLSSKLNHLKASLSGFILGGEKWLSNIFLRFLTMFSHVLSDPVCRNVQYVVTMGLSPFNMSLHQILFFFPSEFEFV